MTTLIEQLASLRVGTVEYVSPDRIEVLLDIESPDSVALNTGTPRSFPRINGYVMIPIDLGFVVGQVSWITIQRSPYPKRSGFQDFGLIDLPFPLRKMELQPVKINGLDYTFSTGKHNQLQKAVIEQFAPRFAPYSSCLYVGDTTKKDLLKNVEKMKELGFEITMHDKLPDVVLYNEDKDWIYFIECVTSVGPVNPKRMLEITEMTSNVKSGKIFVTAFLDMNTAKKFIQDIAWETEIWVADSPEHMIHMNGDKFLGPR